MLGAIELPTYLVGVIMIILLPGPNSIYVLSLAARRGVRAGYRGAAGVFCGDTVLMVLSAAGVASLLQANELAFSVVKYAGAGYLTYLAVGMMRAAWSMWRARHESVPDDEPVVAEAGPAGTEGPAEDERPFRRAFVICLFNPKAILFFISFFVQFVDPAYAYPALSFLVLGAIAQVVSLLYLTALIFGGTWLATAFRRRRRLSAAATSAVGALFLGFAAKLSLSGA
ncbi:leucine efflux protein LeuE [Streptomyces niveus]|uniref:Leucine efflux protein LeuE n=1 Tax=Streptomyces niveus TaxID=193462 RepID=A0ABZ2A271_STRNV|nr:leucine efflux protein LeuE [Streptomyces niveus]